METNYHIRLKKENAGEYAILTGDPARVPQIAKLLDSPCKAAQNREYTTYTGMLNGAKVNVMSVGIGGPSMAIGVEELYKLGVKTFIRIGTSGGIDLNVKAGDLVIATAAVRQEGTTTEYLPPFFPAAADFSVVTALQKSVDAQKLSRHIGIVQSKDSFYGELEPERMPERERLVGFWETYKRSGVLVSEMECAALFILGSVLRVRTGALLLCIWNEERSKALGDKTEFHDTSRMYAAAADALRLLIKEDRG